MKLLCDVFKKDFLVKMGDWLDRDADFQELWKSLNPWQLQADVPILDTVHHVMDATPHDLSPPGEASRYSLEAALFLLL